MPIPPNEIKTRLTAAFPDADVHVVDLTGTQDHYEARVVTKAFEGKSMIEQHQLVYGALGDAIHGPIHALALTTYTPEVWTKVVQAAISKTYEKST